MVRLIVDLLIGIQRSCLISCLGWMIPRGTPRHTRPTHGAHGPPTPHAAHPWHASLVFTLNTGIERQSGIHAKHTLDTHRATKSSTSVAVARAKSRKTSWKFKTKRRCESSSCSNPTAPLEKCRKSRPAPLTGGGVIRRTTENPQKACCSPWHALSSLHRTHTPGRSNFPWRAGTSAESYSAPTAVHKSRGNDF